MLSIDLTTTNKRISFFLALHVFSPGFISDLHKKMLRHVKERVGTPFSRRYAHREVCVEMNILVSTYEQDKIVWNPAKKAIFTVDGTGIGKD